MEIAVIGAGKLGFPIALYIFEKTSQCITLIEKNHEIVEKINNGVTPFFDKDSVRLEKLLKKGVDEGKLFATDDSSVLSKVDVAIVVVPLPIDRKMRPDFKNIDQATESIRSSMKSGGLVIYETTLPVGTVRNRISKKLKRDDLYLAYSPERVYMGRVMSDLKRYPKLISAVNEASLKKIKSFYSDCFDQIVDMGATENAEMAKLSEAIYRDVNIGLSNQLALYGESFGCDMRLIKDACNTQPYSHLHDAGISVGGHCIPVYPYFLIENEKRERELSIIAEARKTNENMPTVLLRQAISFLSQSGKDSSSMSFAVLGLSFREGSKELVNSGSISLIEQLEALNVHKVYVHDPLFTESEISKLGYLPYSFTEAVDCVILHTPHSSYLDLNDKSFLIPPKLILDGRTVLKREHFKQITLKQLGVG